MTGRILKAIDRLITSVLTCSNLTITKPDTLPKQMINSNGDKTILSLTELNHATFNKVNTIAFYLHYLSDITRHLDTTVGWSPTAARLAKSIVVIMSVSAKAATA